MGSKSFQPNPSQDFLRFPLWDSRRGWKFPLPSGAQPGFETCLHLNAFSWRHGVGWENPGFWAPGGHLRLARLQHPQDFGKPRAGFVPFPPCWVPSSSRNPSSGTGGFLLILVFYGIKSLFRMVSIPASLHTWCPHRNRGSRRDRSSLRSLSGGFLTSVPISELLLPKFGAFTPNSRSGIRVQLSSKSGRDGGGLIPPQFGNSEEFCGKKSFFWWR